MIRRSLRTLVFLASIVSVGVYALGAWQAYREQHPPVPHEKTLIEQANGISRNVAIYADPSESGETPVMPGFGYLMATILGDAVAQVWTIRLLGLAISLALSVLVLLTVYSETESWTLGFAAMGFSVLGIALFGSSPGVAGPESLLLLLGLLGFLALRFTHGVWGALAGAVLLNSAMFVDVQGAWFLLGAWVSLAFEERRRLFAFAVTTFLLLGGGYVALSILYGPWFNYAAWDAGIHSARFAFEGAIDFVTSLILGSLGVCTVVAALSYAMTTPPWYGKKGIWMCFGVSAVLGALVSTQSVVPDPNAVLPAVVAVSMLGVFSLQRVVYHLSASLDDDASEGEPAMLTALLLQFVVLYAAVRLEPWAVDTARAIGFGV